MAVRADDARMAGTGGSHAAGQGEPRPSSREDARLVRALRAGEPDAFAELVADYQGAVFNLALRLVRDREDARDITQDVLIKAHGAIPTTAGELRLWAWLYRVTVNTCWDHLRAASRRPRPSADAEDLVAAHAADDDERAEVARLFSESLAALPPRQQAALLLKDVHGLGHADIAEALGITRGSSKVLLFHARHSFRRAYEALVADDPLPRVCRMAEDAVASSVGGRLTASQRRAVLHHARTCADCRRVVERWTGPHAVGLALALPFVAAPQLFGPAAGVPAGAGPGLLATGASIGAGPAAGAGAAAVGSAAGAGAAAGAGTSGAALSMAGGVAAKLAGLGVAKAAAVVIAATSVAAYTGADASTGRAERPPHRAPVASAAARPGAAATTAVEGFPAAAVPTSARASTGADTLPQRTERPGHAPAWLERHLKAARAAAAARGWPTWRHQTRSAGRFDRPPKNGRAGATATRGRLGRRAAARAGVVVAAGRRAARSLPRLHAATREAGVAWAPSARGAIAGAGRTSQSAAATTRAPARKIRPAGEKGRGASTTAPDRRLSASVFPSVKPREKVLPPVQASGKASSPRRAPEHSQAASLRAAGARVLRSRPPRLRPDRPATSPPPERAQDP